MKIFASGQVSYRPFLFLHFCLSFYNLIDAQNPRLVADLTPGNHSSEPSAPVQCGKYVFFTANDGLNGSELWKSNGTEKGTVLVKDLCEGFCGSRPKNLCDVDGILFFTAYESDKGTELWRSDGTEKGTYRVKDINTGSANFSPRYLTKMGKRLFFTAHDGINGAELWVSDGTEKGTTMIRDIMPGKEGSHPMMLRASGDKLYFKCKSSGSGGEELWQSDGTEAGTIRVTAYKEIHDLRTSDHGQTIYFVAENPDSPVKIRYQLWEYEPRLARTTLLHSSANLPLLSESGKGGMFFSDGNILYRISGRSGKNEKITSLPVVSVIRKIQTTGDFCVFNVSKGKQSGNGTATWISDGTAAGTYMLGDWECLEAMMFHDRLFLNGALDTVGSGLYISTGRREGTILAEMNKGISHGSDPGNFCVFNDQLFFTADDGQNGREIWIAGKDGTTGMLKNINTRGLSTSPFNLTSSGTNLFFMTGQTEGNLFLWFSDGSKNGTRKLHDFGLGYESPEPESLCEMDGNLFVMLRKNNDGKTNDAVTHELWFYRYAESKVIHIRSFNGPVMLGSELHRASWKGKLFFTVCDRAAGEELWVSDGTTGGTRLLKDILRGPKGSSPRWLTPSGKYLYFTADNFNEGRELWRTDGTEQGTIMVFDIWNGGHSAEPVFLRSAGDLLYFSADNGLHGHEMWRTDGTAAGTKMVADIRKGPEGSFPEEITPAGNLVFFAADNGKQGMELWCTDGTEAGTRLVLDIYAGGADASPGKLFELNGRLLFVCNDGKHGAELWKSNGTTKGTSMVRDIQKGKTGSGCRSFTRVNGMLYFIAADGENNPEIWKTDGSGSGTGMVKGAYSGTNILPPMMLTRCGNKLYFVVDDHEHGTELWCID